MRTLNRLLAYILVLSMLLGSTGCAVSKKSDSRDWIEPSTEKLIKEGVIPNDIDTMTFGELLTYKAKNCPNVVIASEDGYELTWAEMDIAVKNMIKKLQEDGVEEGDVVGLYGRNSVNWMISFYALQAMGTVTHLLNCGTDEDTIIPMIAKYDIDYLVMGRVDEWDIKPDYDEIIKEKTPIKGIMDIRKANVLTENLEDNLDIEYVDHDENAQSIVLYTSSYKGIEWISCMTHTPSDFMKIGIIEAQALMMTPEDKELVFAALFHMLGFSYGLVAANIYNVEAFMVKEDCREIRVQTICDQAVQNGITIIPAIANTINRLIYDDAFTEEVAKDLTSIRSIAVAGSPIYPNQIQRLYECFPNVTLTVLYGATECAPISFTAYSDDYEHITNSVGKLSPLTEAKVTDDGELLVRSEFQMKEVYKEPDEKRFDEEGWLHTSDFASIDEDGYINIRGKLYERMNVNGEEFFLGDITRYLMKSPDFTDAYSFTVDVDGETKIGTCVIMNNKEFDEEEIREYIKTGLGENLVPDYITSIDEFPQMPNGKIFYFDLTQEVAEKLNISIDD